MREWEKETQRSVYERDNKVASCLSKINHQDLDSSYYVWQLIKIVFFLYRGNITYFSLGTDLENSILTTWCMNEIDFMRDDVWLADFTTKKIKHVSFSLLNM